MGVFDDLKKLVHPYADEDDDYDMEFEENLNLKIMGSIESDPTIGQISNESPLGRALIGKAKDDIVEVSTPAGIQKYKILSIKY